MKFWKIDAETREVIGSGEANKWNIPRNALLVQPLPPKEGFAVVATIDFKGSKYIPDYRGRTIFSTEDTHQSKHVEYLGEIEKGWTLKERLPYSIWQNDDWLQQIDLLKDSKLNEINQWRKAQEDDSTTVVNAVDARWDACPDARSRIDSALLAQQMPPYWTDAEDVDHFGMTLDELRLVKVAIGDFLFNVHDRQRTMKKEVEMLTDFDECLSYPVGWQQR